MTISVTNDGRYYFTPTSDPEHRKKLLEAMGEKNKITFTDKEKQIFAKTEFVGVSVSQLKGFLTSCRKTRERISKEVQFLWIVQ